MKSITRVSAFVKSLSVVGLVAPAAIAQPTPAPTGGDLLCSPGGPNPQDTSAVAQLDTVVAALDAEGFRSIFDGTSFTGWWQNCRSSHSSSDRVNGAIWRIDPERQAIYSTQRGSSTGGLLSTKKKYLHYELVFETWAGFGNDAGVFHRNRVSGRSYQTVLDYLSGASFGGTWGEGGFPSRDHRPSAFSGNDSTLSIPGNSGNNWTTFTAGLRAAGQDFPCPMTGCTQASWREHWKMGSNPAVTDGWNTVRIKFYGGTAPTGQHLTNPGADRVRMQSFFKSKLDPATRVDEIKWIPLWADSMAYTGAQVDSFGVANPVAFQVHGGGRFGAARGTWYRNIRIRELDSLGEYTGPISAIHSAAPAPVRYDVRTVANVLTGTMDRDYTIRVSDVSGRVLDRMNGRAGRVEYALPLRGQGVLLVEISSGRGVQNLRIGRVSR